MENTIETGTDTGCNTTGWRGTNTGRHLKTSSWNGDNTSGFTALPGGFREINGAFNYMGIYVRWWSSTESGSSAFRRRLDSSNTGVNRDAVSEANGFSVRCVQD